MPTVIRKSDGRPFDVFGLTKLELREEFVFLIWDMGRWQWAGVSDFEPKYEHYHVGEKLEERKNP